MAEVIKEFLLKWFCIGGIYTVIAVIWTVLEKVELGTATVTTTDSIMCAILSVLLYHFLTL